jgi:hypothetical protein
MSAAILIALQPDEKHTQSFSFLASAISITVVIVILLLVIVIMGYIWGMTQFLSWIRALFIRRSSSTGTEKGEVRRSAPVSLHVHV